jgi:hypothetical protein
MTTRRLNPDESTIVVRTRAEGLLSRLAHDLELHAKQLEGQVHLEDDEQAWSATLRFPIVGLTVVGVLRAGAVDEGVLSVREQTQITDKIQSDVLPGREVLVRVNGKTRDAGQGVVRAPRGQHRIRFDLKHDEENGAIAGQLELSLERLGIAPIRGPLGAFRVADKIVVHFRIVLR